MNDELCGEVHPDKPEVVCDKQVPCYVMHHSRVTNDVWDGEQDPRTVVPKGKSRAKELADLASHVEPSKKAGPPLPLRRPHQQSEYENPVQDPEWVNNAVKVFHDFLSDRAEDFTTPEDLWPLLDSPREMREMVQVVRRALRQKWIEEVAAKRLNGVYRTRDGVEFKMNKLVPIYRSLLS